MSVRVGDETFDSVEDMFLDMLARRAARPMWRKAYDYVKAQGWRAGHWPGQTLREFRWRRQRARRGWASRDLWSLDHYLLRWLPDAIAEMREIAHGYPAGILDEPGLSLWEIDDRDQNDKTRSDRGMEAWKDVLSQIEDGLRAGRELLDTRVPGVSKIWQDPDARVWESWDEIHEYEDDLQRRFDEGWALMGKWMFSLWD